MTTDLARETAAAWALAEHLECQATAARLLADGDPLAELHAWGLENRSRAAWDELEHVAGGLAMERMMRTDYRPRYMQSAPLTLRERVLGTVIASLMDGWRWLLWAVRTVRRGA